MGGGGGSVWSWGWRGVEVAGGGSSGGRVCSSCLSWTLPLSLPLSPSLSAPLPTPHSVSLSSPLPVTENVTKRPFYLPQTRKASYKWEEERRSEGSLDNGKGKGARLEDCGWI